MKKIATLIGGNIDADIASTNPDFWYAAPNIVSKVLVAAQEQDIYTTDSENKNIIVKTTHLSGLVDILDSQVQWERFWVEKFPELFQSTESKASVIS